MSLAFTHYPVAEVSEWMVRVGASCQRQALVLSPVFQEGPRVRTALIAVMRLLAERGIGCSLPDLPGCGESEQMLPERFSTWRAAAASALAVSGAQITVAVRSGALLDGVVPPARRWRLSPLNGAAVLRDLARAAAIASAESGERRSASELNAAARADGVRLVGYAMAPLLARDLDEAMVHEPAGRVVRLVGDDRSADTRLAGPLLWRAAEPIHDAAFAQVLAGDIADWAETCDGF